MRLPRKLKKKAKKRKAAHDAMVMVQAAMVTSMGRAQVAIVASEPFHYPNGIGLKALRVAEITIGTDQAVSKCMAQMKHYREFVKVN